MAKHKILLIVLNGAVEVIPATVPKGIAFEIIDVDAVKEYGRKAFQKLSKRAQSLVLTRYLD
jgi:hypothetical protein